MEKPRCIYLKIGLIISLSWSSLRFSRLQDSNTEARNWLFRGSWNTSTGANEGICYEANFIADMYHCTLACYIAARKRLITEPSMFLWISAFSTFSTSSSYFHFVPFYSASLLFYSSSASFFFSQRPCTTQIGRESRCKN